MPVTPRHGWCPGRGNAGIRAGSIRRGTGADVDATSPAGRSGRCGPAGLGRGPVWGPRAADFPPRVGCGRGSCRWSRWRTDHRGHATSVGARSRPPPPDWCSGPFPRYPRPWWPARNWCRWRSGPRSGRWRWSRRRGAGLRAGMRIRSGSRSGSGWRVAPRRRRDVASWGCGASPGGWTGPPFRTSGGHRPRSRRCRCAGGHGWNGWWRRFPGRSERGPPAPLPIARWRSRAAWGNRGPIGVLRRSCRRRRCARSTPCLPGSPVGSWRRAAPRGPDPRCGGIPRRHAGCSASTPGSGRPGRWMWSGPPPCFRVPPCLPGPWPPGRYATPPWCWCGCRAWRPPGRSSCGRPLSTAESRDACCRNRRRRPRGWARCGRWSLYRYWPFSVPGPVLRCRDWRAFGRRRSLPATLPAELRWSAFFSCILESCVEGMRPRDRPLRRRRRRIPITCGFPPCRVLPASAGDGATDLPALLSGARDTPHPPRRVDFLGLCRPRIVPGHIP